MNITLMLVGISGVGKTTFLRKVSKTLAFQHLTAGTLIAAGAEQKRDRLRLSDIVNNQRHLIEGFRLMRNPDAEVVVLDGHAVIDTGSELKEIETEVFLKLGIAGMVHLEATPEHILRNRTEDTSRNRPLLSIDTLSAHQQQSFTCASNAAQLIDVPFLRVGHSDYDNFINFVVQVKERQR